MSYSKKTNKKTPNFIAVELQFRYSMDVLKNTLKNSNPIKHNPANNSQNSGTRMEMLGKKIQRLTEFQPSVYFTV